MRVNRVFLPSFRTRPVGCPFLPSFALFWKSWKLLVRAASLEGRFQFEFVSSCRAVFFSSTDVFFFNRIKKKLLVFAVVLFSLAIFGRLAAARATFTACRPLCLFLVPLRFRKKATGQCNLGRRSVAQLVEND